MTEGTGLFPMIGGPEALGSILDEEEPVFLTDGPDGVIVTGIAQNIHCHHGLGGQLPLRQHGLDLPLQALRAQAVGVRRDVAEHSGGPEHLGRLRRGDEGHVRAEHRVPRTHTCHHIGDLQGIRAVGAGDAVLPAGEGRQLRLQLLHIRAADKLGRVQNGVDVGVDLLFQSMVLCFQINKLHISHAFFLIKGFAGFPTTV